MTTIRGYSAADLESCRALWVDLAQHHRELYGSDAIGGRDPGALFDEHLDSVGPERVWVAELGGRVVGMAGLIVAGTEGEVEPVVVAPGHRGRGIGADLVGRVFEAARSLGLRTLSVRPVGRNGGAIRFFSDAGFDTLGHVELMMDLVGDREWVEGETIADRQFRV